jgi:hypothetical protein
VPANITKAIRVLTSMHPWNPLNVDLSHRSVIPLYAVDLFSDLRHLFNGGFVFLVFGAMFWHSSEPEETA